MTRISILLILAAMSMFAAEGPKAAPTKKKAAPVAKPGPKPAASAAPQAAVSKTLMTVPPGAVEIEGGTWRYLDADGKAWRYRKTPFGLVRFPEQDALSPEDEPLSDIAAVDKGETVEFQRRTPFGISKWTRKKSELDANEKLALERSRRPAAGAAKAAQE